jgi:hypothetical protein
MRCYCFEKKYRAAERFLSAQGIEAVSFFAAGKKDTSGKPGSRRRRECAQKFLSS